MPRLTDARREAFAVAYASRPNGLEAAIAAGYNAGSAAVQAGNLLAFDDVQQRVRELMARRLHAADITAERVMLELGRVAFSDIRGIVDDSGELKRIADFDDDTAACISGIEVEVRTEPGPLQLDLATGTMKPSRQTVRTAKIKRYDKVPALNILAKHFKLVGDEGDGVNALASALADRLKGARRRVETIDNITGEVSHEAITHERGSA